MSKTTQEDIEILKAYLRSMTMEEVAVFMAETLRNQVT